MVSARIVDRSHARVGGEIADYRLEALLGVGGMAAVYRATQRAEGRPVAIKVLHDELATIPDVRMRFAREGVVANRILHPGAVRVFEANDGKPPYLALELLAGTSVASWLEGCGGRLDLATTLSLAVRVLDVLAVAHAIGVVHRDIKPDNLFVTRDGQVKVMDFGIARLLDGTSATSTGAVMGTPAFMPPEQAGGRPRDIDGRSDVWSVGALIFTLLSGEEVHLARTEEERLIFAATRPARSLASTLPALPGDVIRAVDAALAFERDSRWPSARAMQVELRRIAVTHLGLFVDAPLAAGASSPSGHAIHLAATTQILGSER